MESFVNTPFQVSIVEFAQYQYLPPFVTEYVAGEQQIL
jgi:hypothetical protein